MGVKLLSRSGEALIRRIASVRDYRAGMCFTPSQVGCQGRGGLKTLAHVLSRGLVTVEIGNGGLKVYRLSLRGMELIKLVWPPEGVPE